MIVGACLENHMKFATKIGASLAILGLVAGSAYYFKQPSGNQPGTPKSAPAVPVLVAKASQGDIPLLLQVVGRTEAYEAVTLKSRVDGQILSVDFAEGQQVRQGDVLLRLDPSDYQAKLAQAEALLAKDQALLAKTQADLERYLSLKSRGFVSDEKVNEMRTNVSAAAATLRADEAALTLARLQLSYTVVRAPFSGQIGAKLVFPGAAVKTNDTALAVINRNQPLYVNFSVPERHLPALRRGMKGGAMPVQVSVPNGVGTVFEARAKFIDNTVDSTTGAIQIKAVLDNKEAGLTPGQFVNVSLVLDQLSNAILVPNEAVQQGSDGNFAYVVKEEGQAELRKLAVTTSYRGLSAIRQGIEAGETVVTDGQLRLVPGAKIVVKAEEAKPNDPTKKPEPQAADKTRASGN